MANTNLKFTESPSSESAILGTLEGPCADFVDSTRNGRFYSENLWEKTFNDPIVTELIENGGIPGELDHPEDREETDSSRIAILLREKPKKKNGKLWARFDILNTPLGKIAYTLAKAGFKLGISSRGSGDVYEDETGKEVVDESTYDFKGFDLVLLPAVKSARLNLVTEGLKRKLTLKESIQNILDESSNEEKAIISSTVENLGILKEKREQIPSRNLKGQNIQVVYTDKNDKEHIVYFNCDKNYPSLDCDQLETAIRSQYNDVDDIINISEALESSLGSHFYTLSYYNEKGNLIDQNYSVDKDEIIGAFYSVVDGNDSPATEVELVDDKGNCIINGKLINGEWKIEKNIQSSHKDVNNIQSYNDELEADDDGSELLTELQETLKSNKDLKVQIKRLQEELSVCYAKDTKNKEKLDQQKQSIQSLVKTKEIASALNERVEKLESDSKSLTEQLSEKNEKISRLTNSFNQLVEKSKIQSSNSNQLKEELDNQKEKYNRLHEKAQSIIDRLKDKSSKLTQECEQLTEKLDKQKATYDKDMLLKEQQAAKELKKQQQLTEKYKENTRIAVNRYIRLQAEKVGCNPDDIKSRLTENYSFKQIDDICSNLQQYQLNINKLPVDINKAKVRITESKETRRIIDEDEIIDRDHLMMAGLI